MDATGGGPKREETDLSALSAALAAPQTSYKEFIGGFQHIHEGHPSLSSPGGVTKKSSNESPEIVEIDITKTPTEDFDDVPEEVVPWSEPLVVPPKGMKAPQMDNFVDPEEDEGHRIIKVEEAVVKDGSDSEDIVKRTERFVGAFVSRCVSSSITDVVRASEMLMEVEGIEENQAEKFSVAQHIPEISQTDRLNRKLLDALFTSMPAVKPMEDEDEDDAEWQAEPEIDVDFGSFFNFAGTASNPLRDEGSNPPIVDPTEMITPLTREEVDDQNEEADEQSIKLDGPAELNPLQLGQGPLPGAVDSDLVDNSDPTHRRLDVRVLETNQNPNGEGMKSSSNTSSDHLESDVVSSFKLEEGFDYDNVTLTPRDMWPPNAPLPPNIEKDVDTCSR